MAGHGCEAAGRQRCGADNVDQGVQEKRVLAGVVR